MLKNKALGETFEEALNNIKEAMKLYLVEIKWSVDHTWCVKY